MIKYVEKSVAYEQEFRRELGKRLRELRVGKRFTQEALSEAVNVNPSFIGHLERGQKLPSLHTLIKLAETFEVPVLQFFMFESNIPSKQKTIQELVDVLKTRSEKEAKFLLAVAREHRKACA